jgi:FkbM family methyltransferase
VARVHRLVATLDRAGTRPLVALALRARIRQLYGVWVAVRYDAAERLWMVRWPDVIVPMLEPIPTAPWEFEREHADVFFQEYRPGRGDVVVDLGAGMGSELDLMCRLVGEAGRVVAVEADPHTFRCLELRAQLNGLRSAVPVHAAAVDRPGEVVIATEGHHLGHTVSDGGPGHRVRGATLDELVREHGLDRIDLLKINIEGAEARALAGAGESIGVVRNVAVSCHDFIGHPTADFVRGFLTEHGFRLAGRRADDERDWARSWLYGNR